MHFWRVEVPFAMPQLIWNMMMSMSGGWFFVVASEAISVGNTTVTLPGIGSYIALAIEQRNLPAIGWAIGAMLVVILLYDQLLFRPLVAGRTASVSSSRPAVFPPRSWVLDVMRRSRVLGLLTDRLARLWRLSYQWSFLSLRSQAAAKLSGPGGALGRPPMDRFCHCLDGSRLCCASAVFVFSGISLPDAAEAFVAGLATLCRVVVLIAIATVIWVPIGVLVGTKPRLTQFVQPVAQFLAAFPANVLFPIAVSAIVVFKLNPDIWLSPLMILGTQWYILFNVIAGASSIPSEIARHRRQPAGPRLAVVEKDRAAGGVSVLRHRRHHRLRRLLERQHRRRGGVLGRHQAAGNRPWRLYRRATEAGDFPPHRAWHCGDEFIRGHRQPGVLAAAVLVRRTKIPARMTGEGS